MPEFSITRRIEIDAGHRIPQHGSKCRNLHGHRYVIEATAAASILGDGEEAGMVMDFSFLKREMVDNIDSMCDHAMLLHYEDPLVGVMTTGIKWGLGRDVLAAWRDGTVDEQYFSPERFVEAEGIGDTRVILCQYVPTAENLARMWFEVLAFAVKSMRENRDGDKPDRVRLVQVKVWETPNCSAVYPHVEPGTALRVEDWNVVKDGPGHDID